MLTPTPARPALGLGRRSRGTRVRLALVVLLLSSTSYSQTNSELPSLKYSASASCPTQAQFVELLRARRQQDWQRVQLGSPLHVALWAEAEGAHGRMQFQDETGQLVKRELEATDCTELAHALALVVALALDAHVERRTTVVQDEPERARPSGDDGTPARFGVGLEAFYGKTYAPSPSLGGMIHGVWRPGRGVQLRAGLGYLQSGSVDSPLGSTHFEWVGFRTEVCPVVFGFEQSSIAPCIALEGAQLRGVPDENPALQQSSPRSEWWWAAEAAVRLSWHIAPPLSLQVATGLAAVLDKPNDPRRFVYVDGDGNEVEIYRVPDIGLTLRGGLEFAFP